MQAYGMANMSAPPEAQLIRDARNAQGVSIRAAARAANLSEGRWRQIEAGYQTVRAGERSEVVAPAVTLARMARVVGVSADQLRESGRHDAADEFQASLGRGLAQLIPTAPPTTTTDPSLNDEESELEYIANTVQTALSMLERRQLWLAIQLINQASKDLSDYLEPTKETTGDVTKESATASRPGEAEPPKKSGAGDPRFGKPTALPTEFQGDDPDLPSLDKLAAESGGQKGIETPPGEEGYSQDPDDHES
ncbi:immunity repressor [Gordonia phage CheeseTouch]